MRSFVCGNFSQTSKKKGKGQSQQSKVVLLTWKMMSTRCHDADMATSEANTWYAFLAFLRAEVVDD
jgi:hypothetical protein